MNKNFNIECSQYVHELTYKPCIEYKKMNLKIKNKSLLEYYKNTNNKTTKKIKKF